MTSIFDDDTIRKARLCRELITQGIPVSTAWLRVFPNGIPEPVMQIRKYVPFEPDTEVPEETKSFRHRNLLSSMLDVAIDDALKRPPKVRLTPRHKRESRCGKALNRIAQARNWIFSNARTPFSFLWTCEHLEINPDLVRERVRSESPYNRNIRGVNRLGTGLRRRPRRRLYMSNSETQCPVKRVR
jgi:hypothetical protein